MATWDDLKIVLARLAAQQPRPLTHWPDPGHDADRQPPFEIGLAAWATETAAELHQQFGADVRLTVGALGYPNRLLPDRLRRPSEGPLPFLDPNVATVVLDGPLSVCSGHTARHSLLVTNTGSHALEIPTSGSLIPDIVDPATGKVVGGYAGAVVAMLMTFTVPLGTTENIPLFVATDSFDPSLGYAVPPGEWGLRAAFPGPAHTPVLPFTITA